MHFYYFIFILGYICCSFGTRASSENLQKGELILSIKAPSDCRVEGNFAYQPDCTKYFQCLYTVSNQYEYYLYQCNQGQRWDDSFGGCIPGTCGSVTTTTTNSPTTTTLRTTTTSGPGFQCTSEGYFADPANCAKYYHCRQVGDIFYETHNACPPRTIWNQAQQACVNGSCS